MKTNIYELFMDDLINKDYAFLNCIIIWFFKIGNRKLTLFKSYFLNRGMKEQWATPKCNTAAELVHGLVFYSFIYYLIVLIEVNSDGS